ncbi:hypothetical protein [Dictyobacter kobayashii]|nr:hypothetical protein [Dictyobacter kobayashii]
MATYVVSDSIVMLDSNGGEEITINTLHKIQLDRDIFILLVTTPFIPSL